MKRLLFSAAALLTITASAYTYTQYDNESNLSDLALANIEALASGESGNGQMQCWNGTYDSNGPLRLKCSSCSYIFMTTPATSSKCTNY